MSTRFDAETTTTSVYQAIQSTASLPKLDLASLRPQVSVNLEGMTSAIRLLWDAVTDQRSLFEHLEKETNRRRLETEVKVNNLQSYLEGLITQESRRRQSEDEKLRADVQKMRDDTNALMQGMRQEMKTLETNVNDSLDSMSNKLRMQLLSMQDQLSTVKSDAASAMANANKANEGVAGLDKKLDYFIDNCSKDVAAVFKLLGLSKEDVNGAIQRGTEKETLLQTPAFAHFGRVCKGISDRTDAVQRDIAGLQINMGEALTRLSAVEQEAAKVQKLAEKLTTVELDIRNVVANEDAKLLERILDLEKRLAMLQSRPAAIAQPQPASQPTSAGGAPAEAYDDSALWAALNDLRTQFYNMQDQLSSKATTAVTDDLYARLQDLANRLEQAFAAIAARGTGGDGGVPVQVIQQVAAPVTKTYDAQALLALKDGLDALDRRLTTAEGDIDFLKDDKVSKSQLAQAIKDAMAAFEQAINHLWAEMQKLASVPLEIGEKMDATAGRFRCLSCNRDAGPLQEQIRERLSQMQFPPSNVLVARDVSPSRPGSAVGGGPSAPTASQIRVGGAVPGQKDGFGGPHLTASRKKLQNYYDSLHKLQQQRQQHPTTSHAAGSGSSGGLQPVSISGTTVGTVPPGFVLVSETSDVAAATGADGRYYSGVVSGAVPVGRVRPKSAPAVRDSAVAAQHPHAAAAE